MRAAILYGKEHVRIEDIAPVNLAAGEVRIAIKAALTCGTDLKVFRRGYHANMIVPPAVFGHELSGIISEVHPQTTGWRVGERVVVANSAPCDACAPCQAGRENLCDDLRFLNGAYAESIVVPARLVQKNLLRLTDATSFVDAALAEPLACVVLGIEDLELRAGQRVLVLGTGPIGLMFVVLARQAGCDVTAVGRGEVRLQAARAFGASETIGMPEGVDMVPAIRGRAKHPFDVVIEAIGKPQAWEAAVHLVRKGGIVNFFGGCAAGTSITLETGMIHYSGLTLLASFHHAPRTFRRALDLIQAGVIRAADFVNGQWPLSKLPELFENMAAGNRAVKTLIEVQT